MNARMEALDTLLDMEKNGKLSHIAIGDTLARHQFADKRDRAFYTKLCQGVTERRIYLDYILDTWSGTPMKKAKPLIRNLLRLTAYQILFLSVRDAAAINEAVKIARKRGFGSLSGFVNGVLRTVARNKDRLPMPDPAGDEIEYLSVLYSMPGWIINLLKDQYGMDSTRKMLAAFLEERPLTIRTNLSKIRPGDLKRMLEEEGAGVREGAYIKEAFRISGLDSPNLSLSFRQGYYSIQDEASMFPVLAADLSEGDLVMDLCAAPGGKTIQAADRLKGKGLVVARDLTEYKIDLIRENAQRTGFSCIRACQWDARVPDPAYYNKADLVLADLPCSGLGVMGRKKDIKYRLNKDQFASLISLQREILMNAFSYVKPGGQLIYSTCTLNRAENEENVSWILEHSSLRPESFEERLPAALRGRGGDRGYLTLLPGIDDCHGFFVAKFRKPVQPESS